MVWQSVAGTNVLWEEWKEGDHDGGIEEAYKYMYGEYNVISKYSSAPPDNVESHEDKRWIMLYYIKEGLDINDELVGKVIHAINEGPNNMTTATHIPGTNIIMAVGG